MKYTRFVIGCLLAGSLLAMTACEKDAFSSTTAETLGKSEAELTALDTAVEDNRQVGGEYPMPEKFTFEQVTVTGTDYPAERLETYLAENRDALYQQLVGHGITESEGASIGTTRLYMINLRTGEVNLDRAYLPVLEDDHMVDAVTLRPEDAKLSVGATYSITWAQKLAGELMRTPQREYLMASCDTDKGNYICLISSENEIVYLLRPEGGEELPFEEGVDYYSKLYDERLVISYEKVYGRRAVPMVERGIKGILYYEYSAHNAALGKNAYQFIYMTPTRAVSGKTLKTPIDLKDPSATEGVVDEWVASVSSRNFDHLCIYLYQEEFYLLPENIVGPSVDDGRDQYLVIYYEDGTTFTTQGYAAEAYNERFDRIYAQVRLYLEMSKEESVSKQWAKSE